MSLSPQPHVAALSWRGRCDGRRDGLTHGTGRVNAVRSGDARIQATFGLATPPAAGRGTAMERLEAALKKRPAGWTTPETYVTPRELKARAEATRFAAEVLAAELRAEKARRAEEEAAMAVRIAAEKVAAEKQAAIDAEIARNRAAVLSWAQSDVAPVV